MDEDRNESYINDTNPEFIDFKENVKEWITLDDDIKL